MTKPLMQFIASNKTALALNAAGLIKGGDVPPACPLTVGDFVTFPSSKAIAFQVAGRWLAMADDGPQWMVMLVPSQHPSKAPPMLD